MEQVPQTRYAKSGSVHIAYQVVGEGPLDLVFSPGFVSHVELFWEYPPQARFFARLASFSRLILFDKRGTGLSDRVPVGELPTLEQRMDDIRAVMDGAGSERAALLGLSEGGPMSLLFAATHPARAAALVLLASFARIIRGEGYTVGPTAEEFSRFIDLIEAGWGTGVAAGALFPGLKDDPVLRQFWARFQRQAASPGAAVAILSMLLDTDARAALPVIDSPTLVLHRTGDRFIPVEHGRFLGQHIRGARYVELPGNDHLPWLGDADAMLAEIQEFLTGVREPGEPERVLATVLFTDIVGSTERAVALGDRQWRDLLDRFYAAVRRELGRHRGRELDTAGDGMLAAFDGPARAIRCARAVGSAVRELGLEVRAGVHTGECELIGGKLGGIAVHIGARVAGLAAAGEVLVSTTVRDLVAGSGLRFEDRGMHALKGVPGEWRLYAVAGEGANATMPS